MKVTLIAAAAFVAFAAPRVFAQAEKHFAECAAQTGASYVKAREDCLAAKPDAGFLQGKVKSTDWKERVAAQALLGWTAHEKMYKELLASPKTVSLGGKENYIWIREFSQLKADHAPLCLELLMKEADTPATVMDAAEALARLAAAKVEIDVSIFHDCLRDEKFNHVAIRSGAAWLLRSLPPPMLNSKDVMKTLSVVLQREAPDEAVVRSLLEALTTSSDAVPPKDRDLLAKALIDNKALAKLLGATEVTKAVGNVGGDVAAQVAVDYLEKTDNSIEKHWALEALSRSGSELAARALKKYAKTPNAPATLKAAAVRGLGEIDFDDEALGILLENFKQGDDVMKMRVFKSLDTFSSRNLDNPKAGDAILTSLFEVGKTKDKLSPRVLQVLEDTVQVIERRLKKK